MTLLLHITFFPLFLLPCFRSSHIALPGMPFLLTSIYLNYGYLFRPIPSLKNFWSIPACSDLSFLWSPETGVCVFFLLLLLILFIYFLKFVFSWRIIVVQYCVDFYLTTKWISYKYTYIPSFLGLHPTPISQLPKSDTVFYFCLDIDKCYFEHMFCFYI